MTEPEMRALAELAKAATPGPWKVYGSLMDCVCTDEGHLFSAECGKDDAAYIAACDPQTILALISDLQKYKACVDPFKLSRYEIEESKK